MRAIAIIAFAVVLSLSGCSGGRAAAAKFEKVKTGMTEAQVKEILGPPGQTVEGLQEDLEFWDMNDGMIIVVVFQKGKVTSTSRTKKP